MKYGLTFVAAVLAPLWCLQAADAVAERNDAGWLREKGELIFHDAFDREEDGNLAKAIGNGWNSATANRVPNIKMADLDQGDWKTKQRSVPWKADTEWHELVLVTEGDQMRLSIDGKLLVSHTSEGFAHPVKRWFSFLIPNTVWIDDVKIWKIK